MKYLWIICILSVIASIVVFQQLPEGAELPKHWGADGTPDRYISAWKGLAIPPALMVVMLGLFSVLKWVEPRQENLNKSLRARDGFALAVVLMTLVLQLGTIAVAMGYEIPMLRLALLGGGLGMVVMGNFMGKTRSNFFIGIQTPWTLASEDIWRKTHRFAGKLYMFTGSLMVAGTWILADTDVKLIAIMSMLAPILVAVIHSWWLWRQEQKQLQESSE